MRNIITFLLCFLWLTTFGQYQILSDKAEISLLTCDSGNELYSLFGHTALRVNDPVNNLDAVYNYGYFDFRTPNFYLKFVKGDLQYFAAADGFDSFMTEYVADQRGVYEQKLHLNQDQKQKIFDELNSVLSSEKRFYTYKFIDRNCTTMVADVINSTIIGKRLSTSIKDADKTDRTILYSYLKTHFYENLGICILFGAKTDNKFDHIFLPLQLMESVSISDNNNRPLAGKPVTLNQQGEKQSAFSWWNNFYTYLLFFALIAFINKKSVSLGYLTFAAFLGIFLFLIGFYSWHKELSLNYNILLFNPLLFLVVLFDLKKNRKNVLRSAYVCLGILLVYGLVMANKAHFLLFLPMILTHVILLGRIIRKYRSRKSLSAVE